MGLLSVQNGKKRYIVELELHPLPRATELPVEKLDAVFLEGYGLGIIGLHKALNNNRFTSRRQEIIQKAKKSGTEIWFGDVEPTSAEWFTGLGSSMAMTATGTLVGAEVGKRLTRRQALRTLFTAGGAIAGAAIGSGIINGAMLHRKGVADNRISRKALALLRKIDPVVYIRNTIMSHKIKALAEKTGHTNIGVLVGAGHVELADLLKGDAKLNIEQRAEIAARGPDALKMYRCKYDTKARMWEIEKHSL